MRRSGIVALALAAAVLVFVLGAFSPAVAAKKAKNRIGLVEVDRELTLTPTRTGPDTGRYSGELKASSTGFRAQARDDGETPNAAEKRKAKRKAAAVCTKVQLVLVFHLVPGGTDFFIGADNTDGKRLYAVDGVAPPSGDSVYSKVDREDLKWTALTDGIAVKRSKRVVFQWNVVCSKDHIVQPMP